MQVPFLSIKDVTAKYFPEYKSAVSRMVESGWYLHGEENARKPMLTLSEQNTVSAA